MKRQYLVALTALSLILGGTTLALAEDGSNSGNTNTEVRAGLQVNLDAKKLEMEKIRANFKATTTATSTRGREDMKNKIEEKQNEMRNVRQEFQAGIAKRHAMNVARVLTATVGRLEKIATRIDSRIAKINTAGGSTTAAVTFVAAARTNLADAKVSIAALSSIDLPQTSTSTAQTNFEAVKAAARKAQNDIRLAHENLNMAIRFLGRVQGGLKMSEGDDNENEHGTTTATTTATTTP